MNTNNSTDYQERSEVPLNSDSPRKEGTAVKYITSSLVWRGLLAILVGSLSVAWPNVTVGAFVILFGVYAFAAAFVDGARAFASDRVGPVLGYPLLSLLSVGTGVIAIVWPGPTALVLALLVGWWALFTGVVEIAMAVSLDRTAGVRAWWILSGLVSIAFAAVLFIRPDIGAASLAIVFGIYSILYGVTALVAGQQIRQLESTVRRNLEALS